MSEIGELGKAAIYLRPTGEKTPKKYIKVKVPYIEREIYLNWSKGVEGALCPPLHDHLADQIQYAGKSAFYLPLPKSVVTPVKIGKYTLYLKLPTEETTDGERLNCSLLFLRIVGVLI